MFLCVNWRRGDKNEFGPFSKQREKVKKGSATDLFFLLLSQDLNPNPVRFVLSRSKHFYLVSNFHWCQLFQYLGIPFLHKVLLFSLSLLSLIPPYISVPCRLTLQSWGERHQMGLILNGELINHAINTIT